MPSNTTNPQPRTGPWWANRTFGTLVLAVVLMFVMGSLRPDKDVGMYPDEYWARKITWERCADAVLTGDSRVLIGVAPQGLGPMLPYRQIYNFAFVANRYSAEYLDAAEKLLIPESRRKAVFIGITPHSLTGRTDDAMGHYLELKKMSPRDIYVATHFGGLMYFFQPMSLRDAFHGLFPSQAPTQTARDYRADGWVAVHKTPLVRHEVKRYRKILAERSVSQEVIDTVTAYVQRWTRQGIRVYGFIMPSCKEMVQVELELSGFDPEAFAAAFTEAGGRWIETDLDAYESFDGSHLQKEAALRFSKDLAQAVSLYEQETPSAATSQAKAESPDVSD
ncbi:MAG TPA: hypothetical protein ENN81_05930 [Phycisphaerales bacterium]|nr:hypothetical protein [Phycisphaerales bacterium]